MVLNDDLFREKLGNEWFDKLQPLFTTGIMDKIYSELKLEGRKGTKIAPLPGDVFAAFKKCPLYNLKCVFLGLAPYATFWNDKPVSDGLAFSCSKSNYEQPSLSVVWDAVFDDLEIDKKDGKKLRRTDLTFWASQGVLLLNIALTAKMNKPESHLELWRPFTTYLLEEVLDTHTGLPIVLFGKEAHKYERHTLPFGHYVRKLEHPAYAARMNKDMKHEKVFSWINTILQENKRNPIRWVVDDIDYQEMSQPSDLPF